jgi:hypothetical protein
MAATDGGSGLPAFAPQNKAPNTVGDTSGSRSLSSLLSERVNVASAFTAGSPGEIRTYTQLEDLNLNNVIFVPTLFNHDVTLGHHLNARGSVSDGYAGIPPGPPAVEPRTDMAGPAANRVVGGPEPNVVGIGPAVGPVDPIIFQGSCDTVGYIRISGASDTQGNGGFRVTFNKPYWLPSDQNGGAGTVPVINIQGRESAGAVISHGANPAAVVSERTEWTYNIPQAALPGFGATAFFEYFNVGTRVNEITEDDLVTIQA